MPLLPQELLLVRNHSGVAWSPDGPEVYFTSTHHPVAEDER